MLENEFINKKRELLNKIGDSIFDYDPNEYFKVNFTKKDTFKLVKKLVTGKHLFKKKEYLNYEVEIVYFENILKIRYGFSYNSLKYSILVLFLPVFLILAFLINEDAVFLILGFLYYILFDFLFNFILCQSRKLYHTEFLKLSDFNLNYTCT
jgi:hypothetical protein